MKYLVQGRQPNGKLEAMALSIADCILAGATAEFKENKVVVTFPSGKVWWFLYTTQHASEKAYHRASQIVKELNADS